MNTKMVGVVGAGVIGGGVAQNLAQKGYEVVLLDVSEEILERAKCLLRQNTRFHSLFKKELEYDSADVIMRRIEFSTDYGLLREADFVIENVTEKWEVKREVYTRMDALCPEHCILAANTSAIPITRLASVTKRASKVVGIHFMNPVPMKETVEVIRGYHTSDETLAVTGHLLEGMGQQYIVVNDSPGFVANRVLMLTINEAIYVLQDQVAPAEDVDRIFKGCFGHKMGPLETADLIGLDTILYSIEVLYESFNDGKYRPCPLLKKMVDAGLYGRKSGQGFYSYSDERGRC